MKLNLPGTILDTVQQVDIRSPRILFLPSVSDSDGFHVCRKELERIVTDARHRNIDTRLHFNIETTCEALNALRDFLHDELQAGGALANCIRSKSPVIDISPLATMKDPKAFARKVYALWERFPWLDESVAYAANSQILRFFKIKESVFLESIAEHGQLGVCVSEGKERYDTNSDIMISEYDVYVRDELFGKDGRILAPFLRKMVALDNDWDFVFDSYECQSPVFMPEWGVSDAQDS